MKTLWAAIPLSAIHSIPTKRLMVYGTLLSFQGKQKSCRPSAAKIVERMLEHGCNMSTKAVSKHVKKLHDSGWLTITRTGRASIYHVYDSPILAHRSELDTPDQANQIRYPEGESDSLSRGRNLYKTSPKTTIKTTPPSVEPFKREEIDILSQARLIDRRNRRTAREQAAFDSLAMSGF